MDRMKILDNEQSGEAPRLRPYRKLIPGDKNRRLPQHLTHVQ